VIDPRQYSKNLWDLLIYVLVFYSIIDVPFRMGFDSTPGLFFSYFNHAVTTIFFLDIIVNFRTGYFDEITERLIVDPYIIAGRYLKSWFLLDLLSTIPFNEMVRSSATSNSASLVGLTRMLRILRFFKLMRASNLGEKLEDLNINPAFIRFLFLLSQILIIAHLLACIWYKVGTLGSTTWLTFYGFDTMPVFDCYIASLYYILVTLFTVGYGDFRPTNTNERLFALSAMVVGSFVFSIVLSKVTMLINSFGETDRKKKEFLDEFKALLSEYEVPVELKDRVKVKRPFFFIFFCPFCFVDVILKLYLRMPLCFIWRRSRCTMRQRLSVHGPNRWCASYLTSHPGE
jgi:hypothetical protein